MNLQLLQLPKLIAERRASAIFGIAVIAMLWGAVLLKFWQDERGDLADAQRTGESFAMVFEENVLRSIDELDIMLSYLRHNVETRKDLANYRNILNSVAMPRDIVVQMSIIDSHGMMRDSTAGPQPAPLVDLSDREHFTWQRDNKEDQLFISKPLIGRVSGKWSVQLSRRFLNADGTFGGVIVASLDPEHFTKFYDKVDLPSSGAIALIGSDGVIRSAGGIASDLKMGQNIAGSELFTRMQSGLNSTFEMPEGASGRVQLVALRKVKGQPLWVSVAFDKDEALAGTFADLRLNIWGAALLTLLILAAMEVMFRTEGGVQEKSKELEQALEAMARLASEDLLTGLPNLRGFRTALAEVQQKHGGERTTPPDGVDYAILLLDLDRFKLINDTLGHRIGDLLLQETAQRLRATLRSTDVLARLGGDEFAVIVDCVKSRGALDDLASCLIKAMRDPFDLGGYRVRTTVSVGVAASPSDGHNADDLTVAADLALYAAKERNRDGYQFYNPSMTKELTDRRQIEVDLREGIERNELELYYQPIVSLHDNKVTGFEALARWNHQTKGFIPPSAFIPVAEDTGLMTGLGEWALTEACGKIAQLSGDLNLAVNLSPVQFSAPDLVDVVQRALIKSGLAPQRLELEITESLLLENNEHTLTMLRRLRELGVRIALDDFGTGYSALSYLRKFPLDRIKIDRSFVTDITTQSGQVIIVQAVLSIARALGMTVTAEGVETPIQKEFLQSLGCDEAQGFLFGKPAPFEQLADFLARRGSKTIMAA
ncbi:MAG TPA: EAL domain-containing protein [Xanthobacteraceae bacterium]|nr:EAL domain-containing protein [Xanthobacteraceae bacterium]